MTRKHFEVVALAMQANKPQTNWLNKYQQWVKDVNALIVAFTEINPRFDAKRFRKACGYEWKCEAE
jgi:hypothetical protein